MYESRSKFMDGYNKWGKRHEIPVFSQDASISVSGLVASQPQYEVSFNFNFMKGKRAMQRLTSLNWPI